MVATETEKKICVNCSPSEEMKKMPYDQLQKLITEDKNVICSECVEIYRFFRILN